MLIAYEDCRRLTNRDWRVELTTALQDDDLAPTEASEVDAGLEHLDAEFLTGKHAADSAKVGWVYPTKIPMRSGLSLHLSWARSAIVGS